MVVFRGFFYVFGDIKSIVVVHSKRCAFVNFVTRTAAELAAEKVSEIGLNLKGHSLRVVWGRPRPQGPKSDTKKNGKLYNTYPIRGHTRLLNFLFLLFLK
jgi:pre-mRNA-splicing factor RBM22/SLT11